MLISAPLVMLNSSAICRLEGAIMVDDKGVKKVSAETIIVAIIFFLRVQLKSSSESKLYRTNG